MGDRSKTSRTKEPNHSSPDSRITVYDVHGGFADHRSSRSRRSGRIRLWIIPDGPPPCTNLNQFCDDAQDCESHATALASNAANCSSTALATASFLFMSSTR